MTTMATWTGWDANALRKALRMSATDFAQHVGVARRTVAKWSSRGRDIQLRMELQAALDTVLAQASTEIHERFEQFRMAGSDGDAGVNDRGGIDRNGDVPRRDLLAMGGVVAIPAVARLLDALMPSEDRSGEPSTSPSVPDLVINVAAVKADYQACRYGSALHRLVALLPRLAAARSAADSAENARIDVLAADVYHVVGSVLLKFGDHAMALFAAERCTRYSFNSGDPIAAGTGARLMTHALMRNGHSVRAARLAQTAADGLDRATRLSSSDALAAYGTMPVPRSRSRDEFS
jgi:transcriptional regulator with XRE-family HTH domain